MDLTDSYFSRAIRIYFHESETYDANLHIDFSRDFPPITNLVDRPGLQL